MRTIARQLALFCASAMLAAACSSQEPAAGATRMAAQPDTPPSLEAAQLLLVCLVPHNNLVQIDVCTAAINSGSLSPKELSHALAARGSSYLRLLRLSDARIDLEEAKRLDPANPLMDRGLALLETAELRISAAQASQVQAITDCAESQDSVQRLAACDHLVAEAAGDPALAAKAYEVRAFVRLQERNPSGALEDLDRAVELSPESTELKDHRFATLFMAERYREALPGLEDAIAREPFNDGLTSMVATIHYMQEDHRLAFSVFDEMRYWRSQEGIPAARAATIEAEMSPRSNLFARLESSVHAPRWLSILAGYRTSLVPEAEFRSKMAIFLPASPEGIGCLVTFHVGHKAALDRDAAAAKAAFSKAVASCSLADLEYHAARKWLLRLSA